MALISTLNKTLIMNRINRINTIYCINNCLKSYSHLSRNRFYSVLTPKYLKIERKCGLNVRYLSVIPTLKADTTISINPSATRIIETNTIDLSDFVVPEPPVITPNIQFDASVDTVEMLGDLTLSQLHLASNWTPMGWMSHLLDTVHVYLPWWGTIAVITLAFRICIFPLVIIATRNAIIMSNITPKLQVLQTKLHEAQLTGDNLRFIQLKHEQQQMFKKHGFSMWKTLLVPLAQAPFFMSLFFLLKRMANLPVDSLFTGGILWFVDLSAPDPYYLLPVITYATLYLIFETTTEFGNVMQKNNVLMKNFMRSIPIIALPFTAHFPAAVFVYWCSNNAITLVQVNLLKLTPVRKFFNIPAKVIHNPDEMPIKKGFVETVKTTYDNAKVMRKLVDHRQLDDTNFKKAAIGPIRKTYNYNPTKLKANE